MYKGRERNQPPKPITTAPSPSNMPEKMRHQPESSTPVLSKQILPKTPTKSRPSFSDVETRYQPRGSEKKTPLEDVNLTIWKRKAEQRGRNIEKEQPNSTKVQSQASDTAIQDASPLKSDKSRAFEEKEHVVQNRYKASERSRKEPQQLEFEYDKATATKAQPQASNTEIAPKLVMSDTIKAFEEEELINQKRHEASMKRRLEKQELEIEHERRLAKLRGRKVLE